MACNEHNNIVTVERRERMLAPIKIEKKMQEREREELGGSFYKAKFFNFGLA